MREKIKIRIKKEKPKRILLLKRNNKWYTKNRKGEQS